MTSLTKKTTSPKQKIFFQVRTRRFAASFDASTRSVTRTGVEIYSCAKPCAFRHFFFWKSPKAAGHQRVN